MLESTLLRSPVPLAGDALKERRTYAEKCILAARESIRWGILERDSVVLDVGCRNPRAGLYHYLDRVVCWRGQYIGVHPGIPDEQCRQWNEAHLSDPSDNRVRLRRLSLSLTREQVLAGHGLPFPPTTSHPFKHIAVAYCVDTLGQPAVVRDPDALMLDLKAVATQVVVVSGVTQEQLIRWEFQTIAGIVVNGQDELWGVWLDQRALARWREKTRFPQTVMGMFGVGGRQDAILPQQVGVCQKCGRADHTGKSHFGCVHCGTENNVRRLLYEKHQPVRRSP